MDEKYPTSAVKGNLKVDSNSSHLLSEKVSQDELHDESITSEPEEKSLHQEGPPKLETKKIPRGAVVDLVL